MGHRILLLTTAHTYRERPFLLAADKLGIEIVKAVNMDEHLADYWGESLGLDFAKPATAVPKIIAYHEQNPLDYVLAIDDSGTLLAAQANDALGLPHNAPDSAIAARDKLVMRQMLHAGGVQCPQFQQFMTDDDPYEIAQQVAYPCVVKPTTLSGSRGVIRVNNEGELTTAVARLIRILAQLSNDPQPYLVEQYVPGVEVALEGMLDDGKLIVLALFDKPDPLEGPFFEETIYVTPSRLPDDVQQSIFDNVAHAAQALGLRTGPIHAELRINNDGPFLIEMAGRSIGGLCSQTLQFGTDASLEELILRQACGLGIESTQRSGKAGGVMMIPIPEAGILQEVTGVEAATAVALITSIEITAPNNYPLVPLPEGESYLGFIFARGDTSQAVEDALREAHSHLQFTIMPQIPLIISN